MDKIIRVMMKFIVVFMILLLCVLFFFKGYTFEKNNKKEVNDSLRLRKIIALSLDTVIDLHGETYYLANFKMYKGISFLNGNFVQKKPNEACLIGDFRKTKNAHFTFLDNCNFTGCDGLLRLDRKNDIQFSLFQLYTGNNTVTIKNSKFNRSIKQGAFINISGGSLVLEFCSFSNNGNLLRDSTSNGIDTADSIIDVANSSKFKINDFVWLGDELNVIKKIEPGKIYLKHNSISRTPKKGNKESHDKGQYITLDKNFHNGLYIVGRGDNLVIQNCEFNGNASFGLINKCDNKFSIISSKAISNGYIGFGNGRVSNFLYKNCTSNYNSNNGIDVNRPNNGIIQNCITNGNGVDGIFLGQGFEMTIINNKCCRQKRIGILLTGNGNNGILHAYINKNALHENKVGICLTGVSSSQINDNTFGTNKIALKIEGSNNIINPHNIVVYRNMFFNNFSKDIYVNIRKYLNGGPPGTINIDKNIFSNQRKLEIYK